MLFDEWKLRYLRRDDEAYIPRPDHVKAVVATAMYGTRDEVEPAAKRLLRIGRNPAGPTSGMRSQWRLGVASRPIRHPTPRPARTGEVVPMSWHCEDASINYSQLPAVMEKWHAIAARYIERTGILDDWGMFAYTNGAYKPWGDYLTEIDIGIWGSGSTTRTGPNGVQCSGRSPGSRWTTVARSPATAPPARATPSSSPSRWAAASTS